MILTNQQLQDAMKNNFYLSSHEQVHHLMEHYPLFLEVFRKGETFPPYTPTDVDSYCQWCCTRVNWLLYIDKVIDDMD